MPTTSHTTDRTSHLLELMKKGDDAFNSRDFAAMDAVHHPDMIAHVTGNAQPLYGRAAHAAAMEQFFRIFPDVHVDNDPYPIQFGSGDWTTVITRVTGTFTGEMTPPDGGVIPPTGKAFDAQFKPDRQAGRGPGHRNLRLLGRRPASAADRPRLIARSAGPAGLDSSAGPESRPN